MTKAKAEELLARLDNPKGDPEIERQNLVEFMQRGGNFANWETKDALATEYRKELTDAIARGEV